MLKVSKRKLIMSLAMVTVIGGVSAKTLPMTHHSHTTIRKSQTSNIKDYIKDVTAESQNGNKDDADKNLDSLSDSNNLGDDSQKNNDNTNKPNTNNSKLEKANDNAETQVATSPQQENTNSSVNTESQSQTNTTLEVEIPTIYYDRTTSIYANDNITLLRVEYYKNNKLTYYSVVEQFDAATKSYVEKIYQCNRETNIDPFIRTDVYVNGNLVKSY